MYLQNLPPSWLQAYERPLDCCILKHPAPLADVKMGAGLKVQTWTEIPRFPTYCTNGCRPPGHEDFLDTYNVRKIKIPGTNLAWRAENLGGKNGVRRGDIAVAL